jgi:uncharacterized protein YndB with AHSA1/START domain
MTAPITEVPLSPDKLVFVVPFPGTDATHLFEAWIYPDLLARWWPPVAHIDPCVGGAYALLWPERGWALRGQYTAFEPGRRIGFTWRWDEDTPDIPTTQVEIGLDPLAGGGTQLTLTHGRYDGTTAGQSMRESHRVGWLHFLPQLQQLFGGA